MTEERYRPQCDPVCRHPFRHRHGPPPVSRDEFREGEGDLGENSPLWAGLRDVLPDWAAAKDAAAKKLAETKRKRLAERAAQAKAQGQGQVSTHPKAKVQRGGW